MIVLFRVNTTDAYCQCTQCGSTYLVKYLASVKKAKVGDLCPTCRNALSDCKAVTQSFLQEHFEYIPSTGDLLYRKRSKCHVPGEIAGVVHSQGYKVLALGKKHYLLHRLIWLYVYGVWPTQIDHIDHNRSNNQLINLRDVSAKQQQYNMSLRKTSSTLANGVSVIKRTNKYRAYINNNGKQVHLGVFDTLQKAQTARQAADLQHGYHSNHGKCK